MRLYIALMYRSVASAAARTCLSDWQSAIGAELIPPCDLNSLKWKSRLQMFLCFRRCSRTVIATAALGVKRRPGFTALQGRKTHTHTDTVLAKKKKNKNF